MHPPAAAAQNTARFASWERKQMAAMTSMAIMLVPPARPSRPSVRFTAFDMPASSRNTKMK